MGNKIFLSLNLSIISLKDGNVFGGTKRSRVVHYLTIKSDNPILSLGACVKDSNSHIHCLLTIAYALPKVRVLRPRGDYPWGGSRPVYNQCRMTLYHILVIAIQELQLVKSVRDL